MALSGDEIRAGLAELATRWAGYAGSERAEAQVDDGAYCDLRDLHRQLDEAVAAAYGWARSAAHDTEESNRRLLELNREIAAGRVPYDPFN